MFRYQKPIIKKVTPARGPVVGDVKITVTGNNLGNEKHRGIVSIGGFQCKKTHF